MLHTKDLLYLAYLMISTSVSNVFSLTFSFLLLIHFIVIVSTKFKKSHNSATQRGQFPKWNCWLASHVSRQYLDIFICQLMKKIWFWYMKGSFGVSVHDVWKYRLHHSGPIYENRILTGFSLSLVMHFYLVSTLASTFYSDLLIANQFMYFCV